MAEHTKLPWELKRSKFPHDGEYDYSINAEGVRVLAEVFGRDADGGRPNAEANAAFIVKAVNAHDELVAALKATEQWLMGWASAENELAIIRAALAKAEA